MRISNAPKAPEKVAYTKYYEHDGALRAYSNRMLWFGVAASGIAFVLALMFFWQRVQPPTVIRIAANGEATVVGGSTKVPVTPIGFLSALAAGKASGEPPAGQERRELTLQCTLLRKRAAWIVDSPGPNWSADSPAGSRPGKPTPRAAKRAPPPPGPPGEPR